MTDPAHAHDHHHVHDQHVHPFPAHSHTLKPNDFVTVLGWPAWLRVLTVLPVLVLLWLAVLWASEVVTPW